MIQHPGARERCPQPGQQWVGAMIMRFWFWKMLLNVTVVLSMSLMAERAKSDSAAICKGRCDGIYGIKDGHGKTPEE